MSGYQSEAPIVNTNIMLLPVIDISYSGMIKIKCLKFSLATQLNRGYLENQRHTPKSDTRSISSKII